MISAVVEPAIQRARAVIAALGLEPAEVVPDDAGKSGAAAFGGPSGLADTRHFLPHQTVA